MGATPPTMPNPHRELDTGPFDDVPVREVLSRIVAVTGGQLTRGIENAVLDAFQADPRPHVEQIPELAPVLTALYAAVSALDELVDRYDATFPAPADVEAGF